MFFNKKLKDKIEQLDHELYLTGRALNKAERDLAIKESQIKDLRSKLSFYEKKTNITKEISNKNPNKITDYSSRNYNPRTDQYDSPVDNSVLLTSVLLSASSEPASYSSNDSCSSSSYSSGYDSSSSCDSSFSSSFD